MLKRMITKVFCVFEFVFFPLPNADEISFFTLKDGLNLSSSLQRANGLGNRSIESVVEDYVNQFIGRSAY